MTFVPCMMDCRLSVAGPAMQVLMEDLCRKMGEIFEHSPLDPTTEAVDKEAPDMKKNEAYFRSVWAGVQLRNDGARRV